MRAVFLVFLLLAGGALAACSGTPYPPAGQATATPSTAPAQTAAAPSAELPAASATQPAAPRTEALAPPEATERAVAPAAGGTSQGSGQDSSQAGGWVSSYPYGAAEASQPAQTAEGAESSGVTEEGGLTPQVSGWSKPNITSEQRTADIEACYRYAWSQVERDMQIDSDVETGDYNDDSGLGFTQLTKRMNLFDYRNRRTTLINDCMESKGYSRG